MNWLAYPFSYPEDSLLIYGTFHPGLVLLSVVIAVFTSSMALHMASQARSSVARQSRTITLITGSIALGGGVWAMHFIGMLAFDLCTPVEYDWGLTAVSMLPSVAASLVALNLNSQASITMRELLVGGVLMGAGIGSMHYIGMTGMVMAPALRYDPWMFTLSIVVAVVLSIAALWLRSGMRRVSILSDTPLYGDMAGGVGMGVAISAMHYVGMAAARFVAPAGFELEPDASSISVLLAIGVSAATITITCLVVAVDLVLGYKRLSREARANEERIRGILQTAVDGIITINHRGKVLAANQAIETILGWNPGDLIGQNIKVLTPEPIYSEHDGYLQQYMETRVPHIIGQGREVEARHKNGELIPVRLAIGHVKLPNEDLFVGFVTDLREQTSMQNELKANEARFRSLITNIPGAAYRCQCNERWDMLFISDAVEGITGYPAADFMLPDPQRHFADLILEQDQVSYRNLEAQPQAFETEYRIRHRDGSERWVQDNGECVTDYKGKVVWVDGFIMDVTKRKQLDLELVRAKVNAEQAAMSRSAFLANMSHEIRTPMNAIIGFSDILMSTDLNREQSEYLSTLSNSARSLLHLLNDILDVAKLEKGKVTLENLDFSMTEMIDSVISTLWIQARKKGLALDVNISPNLQPYYCGSADRIRQVLMNIVGNAIKFTEQGSVVLDVFPGETEQVVFRVTDTGIGIEEDRLQAIFEPFAQADASMNRRFGGTGLGTTISRQLVELMGGKLKAHSELGNGACFEFYLPLQPGQAINQQAERSIELPALSVLVADDVQQNLDLLRILLEQAGHQVTCVLDGQEAVRKTRYNEYDIILMDVQMPKMDGHSASQTIKQQRVEQGMPAIPIVAMTASVMESDRKAALSAGMDGFCTKPVEFNRLCEEMARVLKIPFSSAPLSVQEEKEESYLFDVAKGTALWASRDTYLRELAVFVRRLEEESFVLHRMLDKQDYAGIASAAHSLRGLSGNLAVATLQPVFSQLESAAEEKRFQDCCNSLTSVSALTRQLQNEWSALNTGTDADTSALVVPLDRTVWIDAIDKLIYAAQHHTCDDAALMIVIQQSRNSGLEDVSGLQEAFDNFDFEQAGAALHSIKSRLGERSEYE